MNPEPVALPSALGQRLAAPPEPIPAPPPPQTVEVKVINVRGRVQLRFDASIDHLAFTPQAARELAEVLRRRADDLDRPRQRQRHRHKK